LGAIVRSRTVAAAVVIAVGLVVAVPSLAAGQGAPGESTTTEATPTTTTTEAPPEGEPECDPSYPTLCIPLELPDLHCDDIEPAFKPFPVLPPDPHGFDGDNDGVGCEEDGQAPAASVTVTAFDCKSVTVTGPGWGETEGTIEVAVPPSEGGESREDLVAGPTEVIPDAEGNIPSTVLPFKITPPEGSYAAVVLVDNMVVEQSAGFTLTGCGAPPQAPPAAPVTGEPDFTG
jgi:hypothetical protein